MEIIEKNPYILSVIFSVISTIILVVDDKFVNKKELDMSKYVKVFVLMNLSIMGSIFLIKKISMKEDVKVKVKTELEDITEMINDNGVNKIHTGNPNF